MPATLIQTSIREISRNPDIRRQALKQNKPIVVHNKRNPEETFFLVPPKVLDKMYDKYQDMLDIENAIESMNDTTDPLISWEEIKKNSKKNIGKKDYSKWIEYVIDPLHNL